MPGRIVAREHHTDVVAAAIRAAGEVLAEKGGSAYNLAVKGREIATVAKNILLELEKPSA